MSYEKWALQNITANVNYEKRVIQKKRGGQKERIILYSWRDYLINCTINEDVSSPSVATIINNLSIIIPGGTGKAARLPTLNASGTYSETNPGGGVWELRGWTRAFNADINRWTTFAKLAGAWDYKIGLAQYFVVNWEDS